MEVTVLDTGDLPASTIISFHSGSVRRHAQKIEKGKAISLSYASSSEPVRVDLMSQVGSHTFDMVPGQDVYDVPISKGGVGGSEVRLKFQIREARPSRMQTGNAGCLVKETGNASESSGFVPHSPASPTSKLQTALMMRNYLDSHDVLRQMQDLLQDMVTHRPEDPIEYMIHWLEDIVVEGEFPTTRAADTTVQCAVPPTVVPTTAPAAGELPLQGIGPEDLEEEGIDEEDIVDLPPPAAHIPSQKFSITEQACAPCNMGTEHQEKVIPKDDMQKARLKEVLQQCWMFQSHDAESIDTVVDAMAEKVVDPDVQLITQGDHGDVMWVIEEGILECFAFVEGENKSLKVCKRGDVFGELALLYNCPRAASVVSRERCVLWELDRATFKAICYEAARLAVPEYDGFAAPQSTAYLKASTSPLADAGPVRWKHAVRRREGVSAEASRFDACTWVPPFYEKTAEERRQLSDIIRTSHDTKLHMLFGNVNKETFEKIVDAMCLKAIAKGENVIEQGDVGDFFYIVKSGDFDIFIRKGEEAPKKVFQAGVGFAFGELALLYNAPRSATITACIESEVWSLDRAAFRNLVVTSAEAQFKARVEFLNGVDVLQVLNGNERAVLAEVLEEEEFEDDEAVLEQGERDDKMFILQTGKAVACIRGEQGEVEVMHYSRGDYFGEIALLSGQPRKASVYAVGSCTCLYISRQTFLRVLGPLTSLLERNINKYERYQDAIAHADEELEPHQRSAHGDPHPNKDDEEFEGGVAFATSKKVINRKRERPPENIGALSPGKKVDHELLSETPPETLADKVAQDLKNPVLVNPAQEFVVAESQMMLFGGLVADQKFTYDKLLHVRTKAPVVEKGEEDNFAWQGLTKLKHATEISVICQKGQKSSFDPTPNQDNFFVHHAESVSVYGVADGHGPFGHLVSFRLVQTLPCFLVRSRHFGKDWEAAFREAFLSVQSDLLNFCGSQGVNIEASGSTCSVVLLEEQTVHIATIGDSRVMLGSWNRRDSRMIHCTRDHKPDLPEERTRLQACGSEVREIEPGNHRIYLPGSDFPGLTMSRAFGDTACAGVLCEPEYHKILMQPTDQWYCILASDGIWEFLAGEEVCSMTAKKLRLKGPWETLNFLISASRKRWSYCCGNYCDDITAILVQWNAPESQESRKNHSLTVRRPRPT